MRFKLPALTGVPKEIARILMGWQSTLESQISELVLANEEKAMVKLKAFGSAEGNTSGTTEVVVVPRPPNVIIRKIVGIRIMNLDTSAAVINLAKKVGTTNYVFMDESKAAGLEWVFPTVAGEFLLLDANDEQLVIWLDGAVAANEPSFLVVWEDYVE